ncbi:MAG: site-specific integrase [Clostridiales bacterium]|nr:site-specific integrase [Clostridiales bacterium]
MSDKSVRECALCCKAALEQAVRDGLLRKNPAADCKLPPKKAKEIRTLTKAEIARLLFQAKEEGFYEMFLLDLFTGLRRGELVGLRWEDLDFTTRELRVQRQIHPANGECVPKTAASVRTIILPASIMTILTEYRKTTESRWMFPSPVKEDAPRDPTACRKALSRILKRSGCQHVPFHAVRHTFAELCLEGGMDIKTLSATLGHESVSTTLNVYTHVNDSMREQAAAKIDRRVARGGDYDGGQPETGTDAETPAKPAEPPAFAPYKGKIRRRGTGCVSRIGDNLWEGRYSPRNPNGTRACHTVYAKSEEECEAMLAEMIERVKTERKGSPAS